MLLLNLFSLMEADVKPFIPARQDGYSFSQASVEFVKKTGARVPLTLTLINDVATWLTFYIFAQSWRIWRRGSQPMSRRSITRRNWR